MIDKQLQEISDNIFHIKIKLMQLLDEINNVEKSINKELS